MKKSFIRLISNLLVLAMMVSFFQVISFAQTDAGWSISEDGTTLTITSDLLFSSSSNPTVTDVAWNAYLDTITTVIVEEGVTTLNRYTLSSMEKITSVSLPSTLKTIGRQAFVSCYALKSIVIPDSVTDMQMQAFANCSSLESVTLGNGITTLTAAAFSNCTSLKSIVIPEGVTTIANQVFQGDTALESVTLPSTLTTFSGVKPFQACSALKSIVIPEGVTSLPENAFYNSGLEEITIYSALTSVGKNCFANSKLKTVNYYGTESQFSAIDVNATGNALFTGATVNYIFPDWAVDGDTLTIYKDLTFSSSSNPTVAGVAWNEHLDTITKVVVAEGVTALNRYTLTGMEKITSVSLPSTLTTLGRQAFANCYALESIVIPDSVTEVGIQVFVNCSSLKSANVSKGMTDIPTAMFQNCTSLTSITIPEGVLTIGQNAFHTTTSLKSITFPESLQSFTAKRAFYNSGLETVTIPAGVTSIFTQTFQGCASLATVNITSNTTELQDSVFDQCPLLTTVNYYGTSEQFGKMTIGANNTLFTGATINYMYESIPEFKTEFVSDGTVTNNAVAYIYNANAEDGDLVVAQWNGVKYSFVYGENAFASMAALKTAFAGKEAEIIIPAGTYTENLVVAGSWKIYGEDYKTNPNVIDGNVASLNENWGKNGQSLINASIIIDAAATPADDGETNIYIAGIKYTNQLLDQSRTLSKGKTSIKLENIVHERATQTGSGRDFAFNNENNTNETNADYTNRDEFIMKNYHYINTNAGGHLMLAGELIAPFFTMDGFVCANNAPCFGYPKHNKYAPEISFTLKNSYFKGFYNTSRAFLFAFVGHNNATVSSDYRNDLDTTLKIDNNIFIDCLTEGGTNANSVRTSILWIYAHSFKTLSITGNEVISTADKDSEFIRFISEGFSECEYDASDRITFKNNRLIGVLPASKVNDATTLDFSENYFADYTADYQLVNNADIPMDTDANYYLDYAKTVKRYDLLPESSVITGLTAIKKLDVLYGYMTEGTYSDLGFTGAGEYTLANEITVKAGETSKATVTATKNGTTLTYTLYMIGVKDTADIANAKTVADTVYYPSLYGASNGIRAVTYFDGEPIVFETGKNSASSPAEVTFAKGDIILPDNITEFKVELGKRVNVKSAVGADIAITVGTIDVTAIGDSITYGAYMDNKLTDSWPGQMQTYLGDRYSVDNFGSSGATVTSVPGYESHQYATKTIYKNSLSDGGDVVIIAFGVNDCGASATTVDNWSSNKQFIKDYVALIDSYKALDSKPQIIITTTLDALDSKYEQTNVKVRQNLLYLEWYLAELTGAIVIDTNTQMLDCTGEDKVYSDYMLDDALHPNYDGYTKMAKIIGDELESYTKDETNGWCMEGDTLVVYKDLGDFAVKTAPWYEYANDVKSIAIEEGVTEIGAWAFNYCFNATSVSLPSTLKTIGTNAFYRCQSLTEVVIPESVDTIKSGAFSYCYELREVTIPKAVTTINSYTFYDCNKLTSAYYAGTAEQWNAITVKSNNGNIANAYPPASEEVFEWSIADGVLTLSGNGYMPDYTAKTAPWFEKADEITKVVIEDGLKSVGAYAFAYLRNLKSVEIAESVTLIEKYSFYGSGIKEIVLPENVNVIGNGAFTYCGYLTSINIPDGVTEIKNYTFYGCNNLKTVDGDISDITIGIGNENLIK